MTTIVYRDGVLAGDRGAHLGEIRLPERERKVFRLRDGRLYAYAGPMGWGELLLRYLNKRGPKPHVTDDFDAILIGRDGSISAYEKGDVFVRSRRCPYVARGSGARFAYAAFAGGATAVEAVRLAARLDPWTFGGVEFLRLARKR